MQIAVQLTQMIKSNAYVTQCITDGMASGTPLLLMVTVISKAQMVMSQAGHSVLAG
jgi:hypothetical protein